MPVPTHVVVLKRFVDRLTVLSPEHDGPDAAGVAERDLDDFQQRLGAPLPATLREYWSLMGRRPLAGLFNGEMDVSFADAEAWSLDWIDFTHDGRRVLLFGADGMQTCFYAVFLDDGDDPAVHLLDEGGNPRLLCHSFSSMLMCGVFVTMELARCPYRFHAMTGNKADFDAIIAGLVSAGLETMPEGNPREACLRGDGIWVHAQHLFDGRVFLRLGTRAPFDTRRVATPFAFDWRDW